MEPLDGNAIAGALYDVYGEDMTAAIGRCTVCGATGPLAELRVYTRAPGMVARCHVEIRGTTRMHATCIELMS